MRIALLSDIHANLPALESVWADVQQLNVQHVFCLGDLVGYYPWPNEVVEFIKEKGIISVQGNYDEGVGEELFACGCDFPDAEAARWGEVSLNWTIERVSEANKAFLTSLPKQHTTELAGKKLLLVHGSPRRNNEYLTHDFSEAELASFLQESRADILFCGHTHLPYHRKVGKGRVINAGSVGKPKHGNPNATYQLVEIGSDVTASIIEVAYDYEAAAQATLAAGLPEKFANILRKGC